MANETITRQFPAGWLNPDQYHPEDHLSKARKSSEKPDYLNVAQRLVWFNREQRQLVAAGVATTTILVQVKPVDINQEKGYAVFEATIRDVLGNEAIDYGSESRADFPDWLEKAATKAKGRALAALGYGTAYAPDLDEGERIVDSPREPRLAQKPVQPAPKPTPEKATPAKAANRVPKVGDQCVALAQDLKYDRDGWDGVVANHTQNGKTDWEAVKRQLMREVEARDKAQKQAMSA